MRELNSCINNLLNIQRNIVEKLNEKITEIEKHHRDCNISTTTGAGAGIVGTVGLFAAPFTGGLSLIVTGVASTLMVAGAATTIGTSIADIIISKGFVEEVNELVKTQERAAMKFKNLLSNLKLVVMMYRDQNGCTDDDAWGQVLSVCSRGGKGLLSGIASITGVIDAARAIKFAKDVANLPKAGTLYVKMSVLARVPVGASAESAAALGSVASSIGSQIAGKTVLSTAGKALLVVGNVVDVASVIYGWSTKHPTLKEVVQVRDNMRAGIRELNKFLEAVQLFQEN